MSDVMTQDKAVGLSASTVAGIGEAPAGAAASYRGRRARQCLSCGA